MNVSTLKKHVAQVVQEHRMRRGLTQAELGKAVELSETTVSRIERGEYLPTFEKVFALAEALSIHPLELMKGDSLAEFIENLPRDQLRELRQVASELISRHQKRRKR